MEHLWSQFTTYHLTENMRLIGRGEEECQFADYLLRIGNGTEPGVEESSYDKSTAETKIDIPSKFLSKATNREDFIKEIFPSLSSIVTQGLESEDNSWHDWLCERAIICPTNADVNKINTAVMSEVATYFTFAKQLSYKLEVFPFLHVNPMRNRTAQCAKGV